VTLTVEQLRSAFAFYSRRHGLGVELNETAARAAVTLLESLGPAAADYPAAVFYAFGRHPRSFPRATRAFTVLLARAAANSFGRTIVAEDQELGHLLFEVASGRATYGDVQRWFADNAWSA
jgi:hypothetical protein